MSHKLGYLGWIVLLALLIALGSCTGIQPQVSVGGDETRNVIEGFSGNAVSANVTVATISGGGRFGFPNRVTGDEGSIGGGIGNRAGRLATVGGGELNLASGFRTTIGGGARNTANIDSATIGGGYYNTASGVQSTVSGGNVNAALEVNATVSGGAGNVARERHSTVSGGTVNTAGGLASTVGGGEYNAAGVAYATVGGGIANVASGLEATVAGGAGNKASGEGGAIAGGMNNRVTDSYGTAGGGRANVVGNANDAPSDAAYATVSGGTDNTASGAFSVVPGGLSNTAAGDYSFAAGRRATVSAAHDGTFLYADSNAADFHSAAANEFAVRATGGVRFVTGIDETGAPSAGVRLAPGSGSWESLSDREAKAGFAPADGREVLDRVARLPITTWSYKTQDPAIRHIGPMAQDFHDLFGVGEDETHISAVDADGVALAAIQGLYRVVQSQDAQIEAQQQRIKALEADTAAQREQLAGLEARLARVESAAGAKDAPAQPLSADPRLGWLVAGGLCLVGLIRMRRPRAGS